MIIFVVFTVRNMVYTHFNEVLLRKEIFHSIIFNLPADLMFTTMIGEMTAAEGVVGVGVSPMPASGIIRAPPPPPCWTPALPPPPPL